MIQKSTFGIWSKIAPPQKKKKKINNLHAVGEFTERHIVKSPIRNIVNKLNIS